MNRWPAAAAAEGAAQSSVNSAKRAFKLDDATKWARVRIHQLSTCTPAESMYGIIWYNNMSRGGPPGVLMRLTRRHRAHGYYTCHRLGIWITQDASFLN